MIPRISEWTVEVKLAPVPDYHAWSDEDRNRITHSTGDWQCQNAAFRESSRFVLVVVFPSIFLLFFLFHFLLPTLE
jgi:hypothetical protein